MELQVSLDRTTGVVRAVMPDNPTAENTRELFSRMEVLLKTVPRRLVLMVLSNSKPPNKDVRDVIAREAPAFEKLAFVGATAPMRVIGKMITTLIGKSKNTRFIATEEEAMAWFAKE